MTGRRKLRKLEKKLAPVALHASVISNDFARD
jgi:hypothetical protein